MSMHEPGICPRPMGERKKGWTWHRRPIAFTAGVGLALAFLCLALLLWIGLGQREEHSAPSIPAASQVRAITASLPNGTPDRQPPVPPFTIPARYVPEVLRALRPAERYDYPAQWDSDVLGQMTITTRAGQTLHITFIDAGVNPLHFSVDGVRCMRGGAYEPVVPQSSGNTHADEGLLLAGVLRDLSRGPAGDEAAKRLTRFLDSLRRSRGEPVPFRPGA